jgi:hypothetical protein
VMKRVDKIEMIFLYLWRVRVKLSREDGRPQWCRFNISVSAQERRQHDEVLPEDEADAVSSSWLYKKEA